MAFESKKFSAAEKHFQKLLDKERARTKSAAEFAEQQSAWASELAKELEAVRKENLLLKLDNEELTKAMGLTPEERKDLILRSHRLEEAVDVLKLLDMGREWF